MAVGMGVGGMGVGGTGVGCTGVGGTSVGDAVVGGTGVDVDWVALQAASSMITIRRTICDKSLVCFIVFTTVLSLRNKPRSM